VSSPGPDDDALRQALDDAHLPTLLLSLAHLTGERRWLQEPYRPTPPRGGDEHTSGGLVPAVQAQLKQDAHAVLSDLLAGRRQPAGDPEPEELCDMLSISLGKPGLLGPEHAGLMADELGVTSRAVEIPDPPAPEDFRVIVIGAGLAGICAAANLRRAGIPFTVIERESSLGGTWLANRYPACGADTPSHLYCLSFAQNPDWTHYFAKRGELHGYLENVVDEHELRSHIRFGTQVTSATYEDGCWLLGVREASASIERLTANVVICGLGLFTQPSYPTIAGLDDFEGPCVHTARWDDSLELKGRRVAIIGTGASAMQTVPAIADTAQSVTVFQRSPQWALPNANTFREVAPGNRWLMANVPHYLGWYRLRLLWIFGDLLHPALQIDPDWPHQDRSISEINERHRKFLECYIESELGDRADELRDKCVPSYPPYGKRPLLDNGWYRTMARDDVHLVTDAVERITPNGVLTASGEEHHVDVLILATGFHARNLLGSMTITGRSGQTLADAWGPDDAKAYLGIAVPDFPNLFFLLGPNTFAAHGGSVALSIEMATRYVLKLIARALEEDIEALEVRQEPFEDYISELDAALARTVWVHPGMTTYYRNQDGRIVLAMPWQNSDYWHRTAEPDLSHYLTTVRGAA
jgi:4-hydroxyacetophenone monooxygenase